MGNPETEICLFANETEIGLFENGKVCLDRKNGLPDGEQQQAISIYFFLEGLGFGVRCLGFKFRYLGLELHGTETPQIQNPEAYRAAF